MTYRCACVHPAWVSDVKQRTEEEEAAEAEVRVHGTSQPPALPASAKEGEIRGSEEQRGTLAPRISPGMPPGTSGAPVA